MGSENAKAVKQCVDDGKAIKKSYDEIKYIGGCWKDAINNAEECGGGFFKKAYNISAYLDAHCHYDNDDNNDDNNDYDNYSNNSSDSNKSD